MYWLTFDRNSIPLLFAYLPQDEVREGGMPGEWLRRQSTATFRKGLPEGTERLGHDPASTVGELAGIAEEAGAEMVVLSLTQRAFFSSKWWEPLVLALREEKAVLAVPMGPSLPPSQGLPVAYWTPTDLEEACKSAVSQRRVVEGEFNPLLGVVSRQVLSGLDPALPLPRLLPEAALLGRVMAAGGVVHYFADFYSSTRGDMLPLIPGSPKRVLDVGCAKGAFGRLLKDRWGCEVWGIEIVEESAREAARVLDRVEIIDVEAVSPSWKGLFDVVVLGDILEHLRDPWGLLRKVREWLEPEGVVITSIPNTGFYPIVRALLQGRFDYVPVGLLCVEHLRFFTKGTLGEMFEEEGFTVLRQEPQAGDLPEPYLRELEGLTKILPGLDMGSLMAPGYYVVATPKD